MKNEMTNSTENANVINMLSLWVTPDMWQDKTLFVEIKEVIQKLTEQTSYQLSERELFLTQELTNGLLDATLVSFNKANGLLKEKLALSLKEILEFQSFLLTGADIH
ncbi:hypothetical protein [Colwellia sp. BRX8-9]|uniref:hypothetical protein n=1 Tax=Colwellia sp. BRX8-9 TaxID=2759831 RepID=UPI0015F64A10|nr:hypothetical protein [Colwellia sp. BRX8-9]MBA6350169.1 hypothetical protein [Colwellia sp. BRX8-9]